MSRDPIDPLAAGIAVVALAVIVAVVVAAWTTRGVP